MLVPCAQGMMRGEELSQAYASADIFVMPSETETLGFVVLEAMASGLPVVAVAAGGLTDILTQPGEPGADHRFTRTMEHSAHVRMPQLKGMHASTLKRHHVRLPPHPFSDTELHALMLPHPHAGVTGFLYPQGDLKEASRLVAQLAGDAQLRTHVGAAARAEVEKFGWAAATRALRERQYTRAIRMSNNRRR